MWSQAELEEVSMEEVWATLDSKVGTCKTIRRLCRSLISFIHGGTLGEADAGGVLALQQQLQHLTGAVIQKASVF